MAKTRRNRKTTMRKNRKQRGAGFFDFFKFSSAPATNAPATNASAVTNAKVPLNVNVPAPAPAPAPAPSNKRSFMNRIRNASGRVGSSLRQTRNSMSSAAKNYGEHLRVMRNTMRNKNVHKQMYAQ